ncbi:uncharacterized protein LAJ45_10286 [Morchella importuna]|uniref:uncharacterized protein n=1 Tax=Morchella importuna TaxID=1174673 RepID=UPI001E8D7077|nr:uncharacterized protein LAJ45_10286 [Morchella importuna]KAH8145646.1 hypothetical protein LAJ45_10286 [Morchella importuna]
MTLACKTADLLALATHALNHLLSGQDALRSADERKSALTQLAVTVQAAARLTVVAHAEALGGHTDRVRAETEGQNAVRGAEAAVVETERIRAETERVGKEVEKSVAERRRLHAEAEKVRKETERTKAEAERAVAETERLKAKGMMVLSEKIKIEAETERARAEEREKPKTWTYAPWQGAECERKVVPETAGKVVESPVQVQEGEEVKPGDYLELLEAEIERKENEADIFQGDSEPVGRGYRDIMWAQLVDEIKPLKLEARRERFRRIRQEEE